MKNHKLVIAEVSMVVLGLVLLGHQWVQKNQASTQITALKAKMNAGQPMLPLEEAREKAVYKYLKTKENPKPQGNEKEAAVGKEAFEPAELITEVGGTERLDAFSKHVKEGEADQVSVLEYVETAEGLRITSWQELSFDGATGYCYNYYRQEENLYSCGDCFAFYEILKTVAGDEVTYSLLGPGEARSLLSFPLSAHMTAENIGLMEQIH